MTLSRRNFVQLLGAAGISAAASTAFFDQSAANAARDLSGSGRTPRPPTGARVVVVGGGMAGTSAARYLRRWGGSGLNLTLVERTTAYTSNIMSNGVLTGQTTIPALQYSYATLRSASAVEVVTAEALAVDPAKRTVRLSTGATLAYDRLVVAPGIVFDALPGLSVGDYDTRYPHAWQAGAQTTLLRNQLLSMPAGGTFVMTIPQGAHGRSVD